MTLYDEFALRGDIMKVPNVLTDALLLDIRITCFQLVWTS